MKFSSEYTMELFDNRIINTYSQDDGLASLRAARDLATKIEEDFFSNDEIIFDKFLKNNLINELQEILDERELTSAQGEFIYLILQKCWLFGVFLPDTKAALEEYV